jgi:hypothetical protein
MGTRTTVEGFDVIGSDDGKVGTIVAVDHDLLIVEGGLVRKTRHAVPVVFAEEADDRTVRLTVSKELVVDSPDVKDGEIDRRAVAQHYGLAEGYDSPETEGLGETTADDPAWSADEEAQRIGVEPPAQQRARIREGDSEAGLRGRQIIPPDAHDRV